MILYHNVVAGAVRSREYHRFFADEFLSGGFCLSRTALSFLPTGEKTLAADVGRCFVSSAARSGNGLFHCGADAVDFFALHFSGSAGVRFFVQKICRQNGFPADIGFLALHLDFF